MSTTDVKETKTRKMANQSGRDRDEGSSFVDRTKAQWERVVGFIGNVRNEMRKVSSPSMKEVRSTTAVVIITVFLFAAYFEVVDRILNLGVDRLLKSLK